MNTFADFRRTLEVGVAVTLVESSSPHRFLGVPRVVDKAQARRVRLAPGGSWLDFDTARCWTFDGDTATYNHDGLTLVYRIQRGR